MNYLLPLCQGRIRPDELPVISPRTIYFFVCSAYVDFSVERRVLQESTYHDVRKYSLEKYGLDVCFIDPRPLEDVVPLEHLGYSDLFRKLSLQYCRNDLNCCPIILLGQKYGLPLLPKRISSSTFDCIIYRMKQKTSNPYYRFIQDIDLSKWYYLNPNVLGEPEWNLNSMDYLGDKLENESFESRKKIIEEWNRERNIIAWVLHYIGNLCLRENLITEQDFNELAITEFPYTLSLLSKSTYVNYMNWTNDKRTINTDCMFSDPIVLQREIIDIQYYINDDSNTEKFIDIVPKLTPVDGKINGSQSYDTLEKQSVIDQSLQDNLQAVTKHLVEKLVNSNLKFEDQKLKVLWRSPNGIDRKFHKDYLLEFVERVKNLACNAIDKRASTKVSLMLPSLSIGRLDLQSDEIEESVENGDMPHTVSTPVITLPQVQNRHTYLARELQRHIGLWDRVWNSINYAGWLIPVASSYKNEIETLLCYIEDVDPTAQVPMLVYSTCETTDKLDKEQFCLANAVAACSFQEIQNRVSTNPSDYLLLIRIYTNPVLITDALLDLAEQISLILQIENDTLNTTTLASFLYSLSCLHMKHTPRSIVIVIGGIEHLEVSEYQESMEGLLPILQAKQLPRRLANGIKLILSGNLKLTKLKENVEGGEGAETEINDGILLPTTSLNLEVCSNGLSGGVTNCMHNLSKLNRCLTNEQLTCVHQLFQQISEEKNLPILACATGLCLLSDLPFQYMKRDDLVSDHLFGFHLKSGEQQFSIDLQFVPRKILVSNNNQRLFILDSNNPYVLQLLINKLGHVSKSFRTSYDDLITKDNILDIKLSRYYSFLLIHAKKNVLVYDYENDAVFVHITRPAGIPREFRLPNSKYQNLVFTAVEFALNDQIVLAAIFRNILIWDVRQGVQLTTLTSSIGVISRLLVDPSEKQLICYISTSKILNLWNLPLALTNATLKQNSDINPISIHCDSNRMDCLTKPISQLIYSTSSNILLVTCYNSDELGVFDLSSGHLTDVFTHNGIVQSAVLSSCGKYALIGLVVNKQTEENANLIWDLSKRLIVVEYGNQVGFHVGRFKRCGSFLQLMPQLAPKNNGDSSQRYSYMILRVEIDISNTAENKATIIPVTSSKLPSIVPGSKPFMTFDDQHLIMQIESHEELKQGVNICQELALWSFDSSSENDSVVQNGKLWYTHTEELKTLLTGNKEYDLHILNCAPVQNMSTTIIVTFAKFNSLTKSYPSVNWKTGSGLSKGMILAEIVKANQGGQSKEWMLVILRSITGLNEWSSFQTLYYSFLKHELYISTTGNYYILPLGTKHVSQEYFKENVPHFTIQSKQSINSDSVKFHGYVLYDNLCIFSHRSTVYLVRPKSAKVITFIDVHHTVTTISKNPVSDQCLFIGTTDGYIISYCIVTDNNDLNNNDNDNVLTLKQIHLNMNTRAVENLDRNSNLYSTQDNKNDGKLLGRTNYYLPYKHMKPDDFKLYQHCGYFGERRSQTCSLI
ncbi:NACHT and WD repeat domain-containing 2-like isoform 2 [Schistosoma japonicum]|uniref:NACHT and WD repeat domain-containing 2-like isoform 2 n=1 Tax=Schistosoma japonicum TaxID=6182 RepID=A0A4Z2D9U2_SCHJA|nr:NACHT and WD repeat domain-containing 2-like isoform 2 [Schistosoma japonicum]